MEKLLEMKEICKSFGTNNVLKNVQFDLFAGEVHALIGENGAGKSTLMKILMGMYKKDSGSLSVLGSDEAYTNPDQALKAGVAMIHQELNPIPDMSVAENIFLGKEKRKWIFTSKKEQEKESKWMNCLKYRIALQCLETDSMYFQKRQKIFVRMI